MYIYFIKTCWNSFFFFCNFITRNHWIVNNTFKIFAILVTTCSRIPNVIFFHTFDVFTLASTFIVILLLIQIAFSSIKFEFIFA